MNSYSTNGLWSISETMAEADLRAASPPVPLCQRGWASPALWVWTVILSQLPFAGYWQDGYSDVCSLVQALSPSLPLWAAQGGIPAGPGCLREDSVLIYKLVNGLKGTQTCIKICLRQELEVNFQLILSCKCHLSKNLSLFLFPPFFSFLQKADS